MTDQSAKDRQLSWSIVQGHSVVFLAIAHLMTTTEVEGNLSTGTLLMASSMVLISMSITLFYFERRIASVSVAGAVIIALGSGIAGLGIAKILGIAFSNTETSTVGAWPLTVAAVLANLAVLVWSFVILKIAPRTRSLLISTIALVLAGGYALGYGVFFVLELTASDLPQIGSGVARGLAAVLNGGAMVIWTLLITRKVVQSKFRFTVPLFIICGIGFIGIGLWHIVDAWLW